jgi:hypothetical protein
MSADLWLGDLETLIASVRFDAARAALAEGADFYEVEELVAIEAGLAALQVPPPWISAPDDGPAVDRALDFLCDDYLGVRTRFPLPTALEPYVARRDVVAAQQRVAERGDVPKLRRFLDIVLSGRRLDRPSGYPALAQLAGSARGYLTALEVAALAREMRAARSLYRPQAVDMDGEGDYALRCFHEAIQRAAASGDGLLSRCG